jgi:hypothetical protein
MKEVAKLFYEKPESSGLYIPQMLERWMISEA